MCINCQLDHAIEMSTSAALDRRFEELARRFYGFDGWDGRSMDQEAISLIGKELTAGIDFGFDGSIESFSPDSNRFRLLQQMHRNVYVFSGFKTYQQLREISSLIYTSNGDLRPFNEFLKDVRKVNATYNVHYLNAEYNHAVASSQMAANWQGYMENIAVAPWLKYQTAGDERVREEHRGLDGTVKRKDDPFWKTWYPPNGWNCRCDVVELVDAPEGDVDPEFLPENQPTMFKNNVGIDGVVFPDTHPYFDVASTNSVTVNRAADKSMPPIWELQGRREYTPKEQRDMVYAFARPHLVGKQMSLGQLKRIDITWNGIQHMVNYKTPFITDKLKAISELDVILKRCLFDRFEVDRKNRRSVKGFHYFKSYYQDYDIDIVIQENDTAAFVYEMILKRKTT